MRGGGGWKRKGREIGEAEIGGESGVEVGDVSHTAEVGGKRRLGVDDGEERVMAPMDGMRAEI